MRNDSPPSWRRPPGVSVGTWNYANQRTIADHYDAFVADTPLCSTDLQILREQIPAPQSGEPKWILDLGCGTGRSAIPLADMGFHIIAVDLSFQMLGCLKEKLAATSDSLAVFPVRANLAQLDCFTGQSIHHAVCLFSTLGMIQGRQHRSRVLSSVYQCLKPGGRFVVHVHNRWSALREEAGVRKLAWSQMRSWYDQEHEFGDATYAYRGIENMFMHRFSKREISQNLTAAGFQINEVIKLTIDGRRGKTWIPGGYVIVAERTS